MMKLALGLLVVCLLLVDLGHTCCTGERTELSEENARVKRDTSLTERFMTFACGKLCADGNGGCLFERICGVYRRKF